MIENESSTIHPQTSAIEEALRSIVGGEYVRAGGTSDAISGVTAPLVVEPGNEMEVAAVLRLVNDAGLIVIPRGGGTKSGWGNRPVRIGLILSMIRLNHIIEHTWADQTVTVEAGCTIHDLQEALARHGQRLALDTLWPERATIGGVLSTNDSGALRMRFGSLRDLLLGVTIALTDGTLAHSGGKVVKNVAGYDLPKLATGALGTLGVITRATFRLHPNPRTTRTFSLAAQKITEVHKFVLQIQDSHLAHSSLQIRCGQEVLPQADIAFEGTREGVDAQVAHLKTAAQSMLIEEVDADVWGARERLWAFTKTEAVAKITMLLGDIAELMAAVGQIATANSLPWSAVIQATGVGCLRFDGTVDAVQRSLREVRSLLELKSGTLVVLHQPAHSAPIEAWGATNDLQPLMCAIKKQFDPKGTLNPQRFVGGI